MQSPCQAPLAVAGSRNCHRRRPAFACHARQARLEGSNTDGTLHSRAPGGNSANHTGTDTLSCVTAGPLLSIWFINSKHACSRL